MATRNMYGIDINMHEKRICVQLVIYNDCTEMHDQQNIKKKGKGKAIPLQAWTGPEGSRRLTL